MHQYTIRNMQHPHDDEINHMAAILDATIEPTLQVYINIYVEFGDY